MNIQVPILSPNIRTTIPPIKPYFDPKHILDQSQVQCEYNNNTNNNKTDLLISLLKDISNIRTTDIDNYRYLRLSSLGNVVEPIQQFDKEWVIRKDDRLGKIVVDHHCNDVIKTYAGAGIIIFEELYRNNNRTREEPSLIMFKSSLTGYYEGLGGGVEMKDFSGTPARILENTSKRETNEESGNLFDFSGADLSSSESYIDVATCENNIIGRCYMLCLTRNIGNDRLKDIYIANKKILNSKKTPVSWKETNDMQRFYLSDLATLSNCSGNNTECCDAEGTMRFISERAIKYLVPILKGYPRTNSIASIVLSRPLIGKLRKNDTLIKNKSFLLGTESLVI